MTVTLLPNAEQQFCDPLGVPYAGGTLYHFVPGTTTFKDTWQDPNGAVLNTQPISLDAAGRAIIFGTGSYRQILYDNAGNMVWDEVTTAPLPGDALGAVAPCLAAQTLGAFRDCAGISAAIQSAVSSVALMPGPTGPAGPQGIQGPAGPAGSQGAAGGSTSAGLTNPGYFYDANSKFLCCFGQAQVTGTGTIAFPLGYGMLISVTACLFGSNVNLTIRVGGQDNNQFNVLVEDTNNSTTMWPATFNWSSFGFK